MNTEMKIVEAVSKQVNPIIQQFSNELLEWVRSGKHFVAEQVPLLVQEIIRWGIAEHCIFLFISVLLIGAGLIAVRYWINNKVWVQQTLDNPLTEGRGIAVILAAILPTVFGIFAFFINCWCLAKILVAPRLFLIEYMSNIVKG